MPSHYVVSGLLSDCRHFFNAYTDRKDAEHLVTVQQVKEPRIEAVEGEVAAIGKNSKFTFTLDDVTHTLWLDPHLTDTRRGRALWHITLDLEGRVDSCERAFSGSWPCREFPASDDLLHSKNGQIHLFAFDETTARERASEHMERHH